jgi:hypothetical protein
VRVGQWQCRVVEEAAVQPIWMVAHGRRGSMRAGERGGASAEAEREK